MRNRSLKYILIAVLAVTGVAANSAQELRQAEKEHALQYLESTKKDVWMQPRAFPRRNGTSSRGRIDGPWRR